MYELLPGVGFFGSARESGEPIQGELPVVIVSHGHMGTRLVYSQLCEALAERGYAVFALEHPGDTMVDVLLGAGVDEATNIEMRVADMDFLLDALRGIHPGFDHGLTLNFESLHALGHSFGAYTVIEWSTRRPSDVSLSSLIALEPYLLPLSGASLRAVKTPLLILAGQTISRPPLTPTSFPPYETYPNRQRQLLCLRESAIKGALMSGSISRLRHPFRAYRHS